MPKDLRDRVQRLSRLLGSSLSTNERVSIVIVMPRFRIGDKRPLPPVGRADAGGRTLIRADGESEADFFTRVCAAQRPGEVSIAAPAWGAP